MVIICKLSSALKYIHNANVIHRDLKPGNLIIQEMDRHSLCVKIIDFGLAQVKEYNLKETKEIVGTLHYMSPEQCGSIHKRFTKELKSNQRLVSIISLTQDISSILDLDELLEKIMSIAIEVIGAQRGYLMINDIKTGELITKVRKNLDEHEVASNTISKSIVNEVMQKGSMVLTTNATEDEKYNTYRCQAASLRGSAR